MNWTAGQILFFLVAGGKVPSVKHSIPTLKCPNLEMGFRLQAALKMSVKIISFTVLTAILMWSIDVSSVPETHLIVPLQQEEAPFEDSSTSKDNDKKLEYHPIYHKKNHAKKDAHEIPCLINGNSFISCRKTTSGAIYLPWNFLYEYFEVSGWEESNGTFCFQHSYATVQKLKPVYKPSSSFMNFGGFNVGRRDRVRCITATEGVPLTTQWNEAGYHYPIQVAQYGLSHHAKSEMVGEPRQEILEDGEGTKDGAPGPWIVHKKAENSGLSLAQDSETSMNVLQFKTSDSLSAPGIFMPVQDHNLSCLSMDIKFASNGSVSVLVIVSNGARVRIHYIQSDTLIVSDSDQSNIYYGLGKQRTGAWIHLARDLSLDVLKGIKLREQLESKEKKEWMLTKVLEIRLRGQGMLDNLKLKSDVHKDQFFYTADWFVRHQDEKGGWPIPCPRKLIGTAVLQPGWYSAMGQGQALSVLARAFFMTGHQPYLDAAARGLWLFDVDSSQGGVKAVFFDRYVWYEEYPTQPSSFVLNGFIYSLLGVYDFKEVAQGKEKLVAERIYQAGMTSLKAMLMMFDSGVGTLYDLRHVVIGMEPNRARWDYHTTHIELLMQLAIIDGDPIFKKTHKRWQRYLKGQWARHN
ncbi:D-glucuronyl c5-epimerase [Plakobranchus ocellatus]|uniref:heparosan-N-sulfate-glucuronate 5-epimerase n=1 Tax=Plakobranchus ocellatus TaxID=259542 RepID=A0AAV4ANQ0_9GAST|nr:D-glucuronyl c5-epimerase [Plakobranchus ocellatus]